jgi:hypothetical protein
MRPFVKLNQALGIKSADLMKSKEKKNVFLWPLEQVLRIAPGRMIEFYQSLHLAYTPSCQCHHPQRLSILPYTPDDVDPVRASADEAIE